VEREEREGEEDEEDKFEFDSAINEPAPRLGRFEFIK